MRSIRRDQTGGVAVYTAIFLAFAVGAGTLAVDFGRIVVLRGQMQNYADSAALAGAAQLDGRDKAKARATEVIQKAIKGQSGIGDGGSDFTIKSVSFYSSLNPDTAATTDKEAAFVEVALQPRNVSLLLQPALNMFTGASSATARTVSAESTASPAPFICHAPPLMLCDLAEIDPNDDLMDPANIGRQVVLKEPQAGNGSMAPGNFGLLALPDGSSGASDIENALEAVDPPDCYSLDVTTATGVKVNKVRDGLNARFYGPNPAPDVINYPRDNMIVANPNAKIGNGNWDRNGYWTAKHGTALPGVLANATRYQVYLYELGETYAYNGAQTIHPVKGSLPSGFTKVTPPGSDVPVAANPANANDPDYDGEPDSTPIASNGPARRLLQVPLLRCQADNVQGAGTYPTDGRFVEMFVTESTLDAPDSGIHAEVVRPLSTTNAPDFHANVRLVR